jgi:hypothetical protein
MKKALCIFWLAGLTAHAPAMHWGGVGFVVTNETLYQRNLAADRADQFYEAFTVTAKAGRWSGGLTLRAKNFYKQEQNLTLARAGFDLYRAFAQYRDDSWRLQAGDFHAMLGRGLVLSVLPNEKLLRERTILGGDIELQRGRWHGRALGGIIRDETRSREWALGGIETEYRYAAAHTLGLRFSYIDDIGTVGVLGPRLNGSVSLDGHFSSGVLSYALEAAFLDFSDPILADGKALFAGCTFARGPWTVMAEVKRYRNFSNELNNPPNADRQDEMGILDDARAARLYLQYSFAAPDLLLFGSASILEEYGVSGSHFYGGLAVQDLFARLNFSASAGVKRTVYPVRRLDADLVIFIAGPWSVELTCRDKAYRNGNFRFREQDVTVQVALARRGSLFLQYQYSAQPVMDRRDFFSGGARVYIGSASYIETTIGAMRGGEICAQGQCFYVQPFRGFKIAFFATLR